MKDMEKIWCRYCNHKFISSGAYKDHMRLEHPGKKLQRIIPWSKK